MNLMREQLALTREQLATWLALTAYLAARMQCEKTSEALTRIACSQMHAASYLLPICMQPRLPGCSARDLRGLSRIACSLNAASYLLPICYLSHACTHSSASHSHASHFNATHSIFIRATMCGTDPTPCMRPTCMRLAARPTWIKTPPKPSAQRSVHTQPEGMD